MIIHNILITYQLKNNCLIMGNGNGKRLPYDNNFLMTCIGEYI